MRRIFFALFAILAGLIPPVHAQNLPDGEGKDALVRICSDCHGLGFTGTRRTRAEWESVVSDMTAIGANGSDEEMKQIVNYLVAHFGPDKPKVNVNKSTAKELSDGLEITDKEAEAIVQYRTENGDFKTLADLKKVSGVDAAKLEAAKERIEF